MKIPVAVPAAFVSCLFAVSPATAQTCGDNVLDVGEQCDDGATHNLDGCSATCQFEQTHRMTDLNLQRNTDAICAPNAFGGAFNILALPQTNTAIDASIEAGATSILLHFLGLDDLSGASDASLQVGLLSGAHVLPGAIAYDGNGAANPNAGPSNLDWWYTPAENLLDGNRLPKNLLSGSIAASALVTQLGRAEVNLVLNGAPASFAVSQLSLTFPIGAISTPLVSDGFPPGHLAAEQLDPTLQSFATAGDPGGLPSAPTGRMCGNISSRSMQLTPVPLALKVGPAACAEGYTDLNHLLDVWVTGCSGVPLVGQAIAATQPDQQDPAAPAVGAGPPYTLIADGVTKIVTACQDSTATPVDLTACLQDATYSSFFKFTTQRVIARDDLLFADGFETVI